MPLTRVPDHPTDRYPMTEIVFDHEDFDFETLDEELHVDQQCRSLLQQFFVWLQQQELTPEQASELAYSADYYLRDYLLDFLRCNPLRPQPGMVRAFAGNWYITRTMEPEYGVLCRHLIAITQLYRYLYELGLISCEALQQIEQETAAQDYYRQRIESFLALAGDGFAEWDQECTFSELRRMV